MELTESLKNGKGSATVEAPGARWPGLSSISQVAFSVVLVMVAGLFLRSLLNLTRVDTGFNKENVLRLNLDVSSAGYKADDPRLRTLYQQIESQVSALPGVRAASFSAFTFGVGEGSWNSRIIRRRLPHGP